MTVASATKLLAEEEPEVEITEEDVADAAAEMAQMTLAGPQQALVVELYKTWDHNGDGHIELEKLKDTEVEVGPRKEKVFLQLAQMDANDDKARLSRATPAPASTTASAARLGARSHPHAPIRPRARAPSPSCRSLRSTRCSRTLAPRRRS